MVQWYLYIYMYKYTATLFECGLQHTLSLIRGRNFDKLY